MGEMNGFEKSVKVNTKFGMFKRKRVKLLLFIFFVFTIYCVFWMKSIKLEKQLNMKKLLLDGVTLLEKAGVEIVKIRQSSDLQQQVKGKTKEGAKEMMTKADLTSHNIITTALKQHYKHLKFVSEEHDDTSPEDEVEIQHTPNNLHKINHLLGSKDDFVYNSDDLLAWIDPLDATQEYTENLTEYVTVMMCVAYKDRPILGIIHRPFQQQTYWAFKSKNTNYMSWSLRAEEEEKENGKKIAANVSDFWVLVSRSHAGEVVKVVERAFKDQLVRVIPAGGAGFKALRTLTSSSLSYLHTTNIKKWDICAPDALVSISGGRTSDLNGSPIGYSDPHKVVNQAGLLVTNKRSRYSHDELLRKLR